MTAYNISHNYWRFYLFGALIGAVLFSLESWIFGPLSWIYGYGSGLETIPTYLALAVKDRNFSTWSPFIAGGLDRLAFWGNANPLGIEQWLFSMLPVWIANGIHRFLQYFTSIFFTSLVMEQQFSLGHKFNMLAGWLMACFSYLTVGALFTISGVPILAWLLFMLFQPKCKWYLALLAGMVFSLCTTFSFGVPYLLVFALGWIMVLNCWNLHALKQFLLFAIALIITTSSQLLAVLANVKLSHRGNWPGETVSLASLDGFLYRQLQFDLFAQDSLLAKITLNLPDIGLLLGLILACWALRYAALYKARVFLRIFIFYALLSQKWLWISLQAQIAKIFPWVMGIYMGRFYQIPAGFLIAVGLTFACYFIWHMILQNNISRYLGIATTWTFITFMIFWPKWHLFYSLGIHDWGEKNYQIQALQDIKNNETAPFRVASVLPLQPAYAYAQGLETADGWANLFPAMYRDLWLKIIEPLMTTLPQVKQVLDPENGKPQDNYIFLGLDLIQPGTGLLPNESLIESLEQGFDLQSRFNLNLLCMLNVKYLLSEYPLKSPDITLIHRPFAWQTCPQSRCYSTGLITTRNLPCATNQQQYSFLTSIIQPFKDYKISRIKKALGKDIFIYKLNNSLPRFRFVRQVIVARDKQAVLDQLAEFDSNMHLHTAVIQQDDAQVLNNTRVFSPGTVKLKSYTANGLELEVSPQGEALLVIANTWNPNWTAEVDGKKRALIRINHAQFGLILLQNNKKVKLYYAPPYFIKFAAFKKNLQEKIFVKNKILG